jgi:hypothetical protein
MSLTSSGQAQETENGTINATRTGADTTPETACFTYAPDTTALGFDVRFDDILIRKFVANEPITILEQSNDAMVNAIVDPSLTFSVVGRASVCNGQSATNFQTGATATSVSLGRLSAATVGGGAQDVNIATNAANGFVVYLRTSGTTPNSLRDGASHSIADVSGTNASPGTTPSAGTAGFGYTSSDTSTPFTSNTWAKLTNSNDSVLVGSAGTSSKSACIGYEVAIATATPAGLYTSNVVYTALPSF